MEVIDLLDIILSVDDYDTASFVYSAIVDGIDINEYGNIAIRFAVYTNKIETVRVMLDHIDRVDRSSVIRMAAEFDKKLILRTILRHKNYIVRVDDTMVRMYPEVLRQLKFITKLSTKKEIFDYIKLL